MLGREAPRCQAGECSTERRSREPARVSVLPRHAV